MFVGGDQRDSFSTPVPLDDSFLRVVVERWSSYYLSFVEETRNCRPRDVLNGGNGTNWLSSSIPSHNDGRQFFVEESLGSH